MNHEITAEERALIDQAIENGMVTKIKEGRSSWDDMYVWCPVKQLVISKDPDKTSWRGMSKAGGGGAHRKGIISPEVAERRLAITEEVLAGKTAAQISKALGVHVTTVHSDLHRIRRQNPALRPPDKPNGYDRVVEVYDGKLTTKEIADLLNLSPRYVANVLAKNNLKKVQKPWRKPVSPETEARRVKVAELAVAGMPGPEVARTLGIPLATVRYDVRVMGVKLLRKTGVSKNYKMSEAKKARQALIPPLIAQGMTGRDIAKELGISPSTALLDIRQMGLVTAHTAKNQGIN